MPHIITSLVTTSVPQQEQIYRSRKYATYELPPQDPFEALFERLSTSVAPVPKTTAASGGGGKRIATVVKYEGEVVDGIPHGLGVFVIFGQNSSSRYYGQVEAGMAHGHGIFWSDKGAAYEGEWVHNQREGHGYMVYVSGDLYFGQWQANQPHGYGMHINTEGKVIRGRWEFGIYLGVREVEVVSSGALNPQDAESYFAMLAEATAKLPLLPDVPLVHSPNPSQSQAQAAALTSRTSTPLMSSLAPDRRMLIPTSPLPDSRLQKGATAAGAKHMMLRSMCDFSPVRVPERRMSLHAAKSADAPRWEVIDRSHAPPPLMAKQDVLLSRTATRAAIAARLKAQGAKQEAVVARLFARRLLVGKTVEQLNEIAARVAHAKAVIDACEDRKFLADRRIEEATRGQSIAKRDTSDTWVRLQQQLPIAEELEAQVRETARLKMLAAERRATANRLLVQVAEYKAKVLAHGWTEDDIETSLADAGTAGGAHTLAPMSPLRPLSPQTSFAVGPPMR